jgi:hypothetical protein
MPTSTWIRWRTYHWKTSSKKYYLSKLKTDRSIISCILIRSFTVGEDSDVWWDASLPTAHPNKPDRSKSYSSK